jgi:2-oxo-4-hydroxy-4-carboxy-5-ureidoimidazoline decarboxylase
MIETTPDDLRAALGVERWVLEVSAGGPFASLDELLATASAAATPLSPEEIDEAIAHHPRIGEKPQGEGAAQSFSRAEQADAGDAQTNLAIAAGNKIYEQRFGRIFIIRAAGRSRSEILHELQRRLKHTPGEELAIVGEQLRDIALLRLEKLYGES